MPGQTLYSCTPHQADLRAISHPLPPPILGKRWTFFCLSGDSFFPVVCLLRFGLLSFPLSLCLLGDLGLLPSLFLLQVGLNTSKARSLYCPAYSELYHIVSLGPFLQLSGFVMGFCCPFPFLSLASRCFFLCFYAFGSEAEKINKTFK